ncbi:MAG: DNA damage-inducible protein D [Deltaproteobacteria bacterium]|nr:DNA damage-inducible protein D [Deltaproteobacteria bacterium]
MGDKKVDLIVGSKNVFETSKKIDPNGQEYWSARDLGKILEYFEYRNFQTVIDKAKLACINSGHVSEQHFINTEEDVAIGSGASRPLPTVLLSRYACYLIVQNADPSKEIVANGQTYFAIQTRKQELSEQEKENEKRLFLREEISKHNVNLAAVAKKVGVKEPLDYAIFQDYGYKGLYGGLGAKDIHAKKNLKKSQKILDHMGSTELAANLFRATQTEEKLKREPHQNKRQANQTHYNVGQKVRQTIKELGSTMPEDLPPHDSIQRVQRQKLKIQKRKELRGEKD